MAKIVDPSPVRWLTYKDRLRQDVDDLYATEAGKALFTPEYLKMLSKKIEKLDARLIKMTVAYFAIFSFLLLAFVSPDTTMSFLGISIKNTPGVREVLLAIVATIMVIGVFIGGSRDVLVSTAERLIELQHDKSTLPFANFINPTAFDLYFYLPRQSDRWIFSQPGTKIVSTLLWLCVTVAVIALFATIVIVTIVVLRQVYSAASLGAWSYGIVLYVIVSWLVSVLWSVRFNLPLPYRDQSGLKDKVRVSQ